MTGPTVSILVRRILSACIFAGAFAMAACGGGDSTAPAPSPLDNPTNAGFVFVDNTHRAPVPAGTKEAPFHDIQVAIDCAAAVGKSVCVAEGEYAVDNSAGTQIRMADNVSLHGGYRRNLTDNTWSRNVAAYTTTIRDLSATGGPDWNDENAALFCGYGGNAAAAPVIDGFTIVGGGGGHSAAVRIAPGTSVTIRNCEIVAGTATSYAFGVLSLQTNLASGAVAVEGCAVSGGNGSPQVTGILVSRADLTVTDTVVENLSAASESTGIDCGYGDVVIRNCSVDGGTVSSPSGRTYGLYVNEAYTYLIEKNTIYGGDGGAQSQGIDTMDCEQAGSYGSNDIDGGTGTESRAMTVGWMFVYPTIEGNHFRASGGTSRYGIYEEQNGGSPVAVRNNTFHASLLGGSVETAYYRDYSNSTETLVIDIPTLNGLDDLGYNPAASVSGNAAGA
jgi:hypothetical protein